MKPRNDSICLKIPAQAEYIDIVRLTLYGAATRMGFGYEDIEDMKVAVSEACNNAVLHAYEGRERGTISIRFDLEEELIRVVIRDEGVSFDAADLSGLASSLHDQDLSELKEGGLGIYLMQALMDDVQVKSGGGTEVSLIKRLKPTYAN